jgi:hypothetical protein
MAGHGAIEAVVARIAYDADDPTKAVLSAEVRCFTSTSRFCWRPHAPRTRSSLRCELEHHAAHVDAPRWPAIKRRSVQIAELVHD